MEHASTSIKASHRVFPSRPDKNYIERVRYWKLQGLSQEDAEREAANPTRKRRRLFAVKNDSKNFRSKSNLELKPSNIGKTFWQPALNLEPETSKLAQDQESKNLSKPDFSTPGHAANLESPDSAYCQAVQVPEPGPEKIKAKEPQKKLGISGPQTSSTNLTTEGHDYSRIALCIIAMGCSAVLIHSLAESLGGGIWNFLIATGFEATPIALVGARINDKKRREKAVWGALLLFVLSLGLFISPQVTTIFNELSAYKTQSKLYELGLKNYENSQFLIRQAKTNFELAEKSLTNVIAGEGESSPRAVHSKREAARAFSQWEKLSKEAGAVAQKPHSPALSDEFISGIQTIVLRIGLFLAAFLSMYVTRSVA